MAVTIFKTAQSYIQFLWRWKLSDGKLVDQNTANLRAEICTHCHNNKGASSGGGCSSCSKIARSIANNLNSSIIGGARTDSDPKLKSCAICGCENKISVWIPNQVLLKLEDSNAYPSFCWKKRIEQNLEV